MLDMKLVNDLLYHLCVVEPRQRATRELGECAWTTRIDNTFSQPGAKA